MDPNECLKALREAHARLCVDAADNMVVSSDDVVAAIELFDGLDHWLARGGFKPDDWQG
jgi:hypothetical protein